MRRPLMIVIACALLLALAPWDAMRSRVFAQSARCFPETDQCIGGRFREFWEQHGGLPVFGFPITGELTEGGRTVQYFERQRFELHPENAPPYDVLLGRLGAEALERRGIDWAAQPTAPGPAQGCLYFAETRHNVCDQQPGVGFLSEWTANGLEFDGRAGKSYAESLALFGLPLTEPYAFTDEQGRTLQVQWFERARFEWHPDNPAPYKVLLGLLGREASGAAQWVRQQFGDAWDIAYPAGWAVNAAGAHEGAIQLRGPYAGHNYEVLLSYPIGIGAPSLEAWVDEQLAGLTPEQRAAVRSSAVTVAGAPAMRLLNVPGDAPGSLSHRVYIWRAGDANPRLITIAQRDDRPIDGEAMAALLDQFIAQVRQPGAAGAAPYDRPSSPSDLLASFYDAIERREYRRAFDYWETPPASYDDFARGYADTTGVQLIVEPPTFLEGAAGSLYAQVPTALIATHADGSRHLFAGCYTTRAANQGAAAGQWRISGANVAPAPDGANIPDLLAAACAAQPAMAYDRPITPVELLTSYYSAVNRQEYRRAFDYWETPPTSYDEFARGYAGTASVRLIVEPPVSWDTVGDRFFARVPAVLIATHRDGSRHTFAGCYVVSSPTRAADWSIFPTTTTIGPAPANAAIPALLSQQC